MTDKKRQSLERALDTARRLFMSRPYEDVTIAQIACESRCSTATLYEAYGSKSAIYEEVRLKTLNNQWTMPKARSKGSLKGLVEYFVDRANQLGEQSNLNLMRSAPQNADVLPQYIVRTIAFESKLNLIIREVRRCMDAGLLKQADPQAVAYVIYAGCGFEPITYGLLFGADDQRDSSLIVRTVLSVLVTSEGLDELNRLLPPGTSERLNSSISLSKFLANADRTDVGRSASPHGPDRASEH